MPHERCESIAEHSFGVTVLAWWLAQVQPELDANKVVRMALLHDLGEVYAGDIIPSDGVSEDEKHLREAQGAAILPVPEGQEYIALWEEFETGASMEARFVRQIDHLEMGLQAAVYQRQGMVDAGEFFASARQALTDPQLAALLDEIQTTTRYSQPMKDEEND